MASAVHHSGNLSELLEPAIEGPPSPESIRAFSNQMRRAVNIDEHSRHSHQSYQTTSSGSSSLRSLTSADRPSWDTTLESSVSLSRKSSGRSTASTQLRDRHESVQIFGKTFFGKRGRLRRDSSAQSSSNSSLYSAEIPFEKGAAMSPPPPPLPTPSHGLPTSSSREALFPAFFNRRRAHRSGPTSDDLDARRRVQISSPYNFQHLTHTEREQLPHLQRGSRVALQSEFASVQSLNGSVDGSLQGIQAESLHFPNFTSGEDVIHTRISRRLSSRPHALSVSAATPSPHKLLRTRSQDQLRIPPPRPPRSPIALAFSPPVPPPRMSSRTSMLREPSSPPSALIERPRTSGGLRYSSSSQGLSFMDGAARPLLTHAHSYSADMKVPAEANRLSRMLDTFLPSPTSSSGDANWPLVGPSAPTAAFGTLPEVPEEDEHVQNPRNSVRRSRLSITSVSSLRKSQSLPLLQQFPQPQMPVTQRPPSGASDTLGRFDLFAALRAQREIVKAHEAEGESLAKTSWEDDIDYCYEHEIEADCEYAWDRPSMDMSRDEAISGTTDEQAMANSRITSRSQNMAAGRPSPNLLSPGWLDMPALSPASQTSTTSTIGEAVTPTSPAMRRPSGLTIRTEIAKDELKPMHQFMHRRNNSRASRASSYKECHGFDLSPSLFIPGTEKYDQFHLPARGAPVGFALGGDDEEEFAPYAEPLMTMDKSVLFIPARTSASTTASCKSNDSVLSDRHISATSTATDLTRLTMSTASIESLTYKNEQEAAQI